MNARVVAQGRDAASRGDWQQAYQLLAEADGTDGLDADGLALLADVAYAAGHLDVTIDSWERAHAEHVRSGNRLAAAGAATRVAMHLLFDTALMAPIRGWVRRAERLLEGHDGTPVHAWLAVVRNYERMLSGDFQEARRWARVAVELGARCDPAAAAMGRIAEARLLVLDGDVRLGLELLEEAAMATTSAEIDPLLVGVIYCELVCALQGLAQYDLAEEWTKAMEGWRRGKPVGSIHGRCRVHRAEILRLRGSNNEAEQEALRACEELRPYLRRELGWPLTELGRIRLQKGDLNGADAAFVAAQQAGWDPQPGLALTYLARGDTALAAASIRHALDHPLLIPSKEFPPNTELRRAPLLDAQVEIAIEAGDIDRAAWAAEELQTIAAAFGSSALAASAANALGRVRLAQGDFTDALHEFAAALRAWSEIGAPYETAMVRVGMARAHVAAGNPECALPELRAAQAAFAQVGAVRRAEHAARALAELRLGHPSDGDGAGPALAPADAGHEEIVRARQVNTFQREGELWCITFDGRTVRVRDVKGMRYLAALLGEPRRDVHVLDLVAAERGRVGDGVTVVTDGPPATSAGDAGAILDARAKAAYRRRLAEIDEDIEAARASGDVEREVQADTERAFLIRELSGAVGLGGRDRRTGSAAERARVSVTRALRSALARIQARDERLGEHLNQCIRTGVYCAYLPDPRVPIVWKR